MIEAITVDAAGTRWAEDARVVEAVEDGFWVSLCVCDIVAGHSRRSERFHKAEELLISDKSNIGTTGRELVAVADRGNKRFSLGRVTSAIVLKYFIPNDSPLNIREITVSKQKVKIVKALTFNDVEIDSERPSTEMAKWSWLATMLSDRLQGTSMDADADLFEGLRIKNTRQLRGRQVVRRLSICDQTALADFFNAHKLPSICRVRRNSSPSFSEESGLPSSRAKITGSWRRFDSIFNLSILVDYIDDVTLRYSKKEAFQFAVRLNERQAELHWEDVLQSERQVVDDLDAQLHKVLGLGDEAIEALIQEELTEASFYALYHLIDNGQLSVRHICQLLVSENVMGLKYFLKTEVFKWLYHSLPVVRAVCLEFQSHFLEYGLKKAGFYIGQEAPNRWRVKVQFETNSGHFIPKDRLMKTEDTALLEAWGSLRVTFCPASTGYDTLISKFIVDNYTRPPSRKKQSKKKRR